MVEQDTRIMVACQECCHYDDILGYKLRKEAEKKQMIHTLNRSKELIFLGSFFVQCRLSGNQNVILRDTAHYLLSILPSFRTQ